VSIAQPQREAAGLVLILCPGGLEDGGGIGRQMGYFLTEMQSRGLPLQYRIIDTRGPWFLGAAPRYKAASLVYLARAAFAMLAARLSGPACAVHVNITGRGSTVRKVLLAGLARLIGLRYLLHVHDPAYAEDLQARSHVMRRVINAMFHRAEIVLLLGHRDKTMLEQAMRLPPEKLVVLPNAVPDPGPPSYSRPGDQVCHLLFLGYLSARKGVPELLHALATPQLVATGWRLTLAGGGPVEEYRALAARLGLADRVHLPGWLDGPAAHAACAAADVLCLPSHAEGLAMAVLEALAHGLAVVTTPVGAHAEAIEHGTSGLLVPPGDTAALAEALLLVVRDSALRRHLQAGARRRFEEKFDMGPYGDKLLQQHLVCLQDHRPQPRGLPNKRALPHQGL
jgi:glycosyltransferase involved in cell wall biosynthesis